jgi:hypothetical protein
MKFHYLDHNIFYAKENDTDMELYTEYVGSEVLTAVVMNSTIFWDITRCSLLRVNLLLRWFLAQLIFSTLKLEAICSSETSVDT